MSHLKGEARARYVRAMFARIAGRYDLLNGLMTLGQDTSWRREAVRRLAPTPRARVLDLGTGTGDLAFEVRRQAPGARLVAADFTPEMMALGRSRPGGEEVAWVVADALNLPFAQDTFDGVISGFLMRNVIDVDRALAEQYRALRPGGALVCLDTTPPRPGPLHPLLTFHLHRVVPLLGRLVAGDAEAYNYLPDSTEGFLAAEALAERMDRAGFEAVGFVRRMLGTVAIHWGRKGKGRGEGIREQGTGTGCDRQSPIPDP